MIHVVPKVGLHMYTHVPDRIVNFCSYHIPYKSHWDTIIKVLDSNWIEFFSAIYKASDINLNFER